MTRVLKLGTRASQLARTQTQDVADVLEQLGFSVEIVQIHTQGDVSTASLKDLGGIGVFAAALRLALLNKDCDIAVHSFKDLPTEPVRGLMIAAVPPRVDCADVLVCRDGLDLDTIPADAWVGTGSPRRAAFLLEARPDLKIVDIRGNVGTRLGRVAGIKLDDHLASTSPNRGDLDAVVLARAGLQRLGSRFANSPVLPGLPAPAQGALGIEARSDDEDVIGALAALDDARTRACVFAERAVLAGLQAGCAAPIGALATIEGDTVSLRAKVLSTDGRHSVEQTATVPFHEAAARSLRDADATQLGLRVADALLDEGAGKITDLSANKARRSSHDAPDVPVAPAAPAAAQNVTQSVAQSVAQDINQDINQDITQGGSNGHPQASSENPSSASADSTVTVGAAKGASSLSSPSPSSVLPHIKNSADQESRWGFHGAPLGSIQENQPLTGRAVIMPRPAGDHLVAAVQAAGARVIAQPFTRTILTPSFDVKPNLKALSEGAYTWCVITSPRTLTALACHVNGTSSFHEDEPTQGLEALLAQAVEAGTQFASLGQATTKALVALGVTPQVSVGAKASQEELDRAFRAGPSCQYYAQAWFPASSLARSFLADQWAQRGWEVDRTPVYTTAPITEVDQSVHTAWLAGIIDAAVFTAGSNVRAAVELLGAPPPTMRIVAFGDPSAKEVKDAGLTVHAIAQTQNAEGIINALTEAFKDS